MISVTDFVESARATGFDFYTGVPCSLLTHLINDVSSGRSAKDTHYIGATSEGEACGIAAGAWLAGHTPVVILQNSGLGNTINPLTSLNHPFLIPFLMLVTWRGDPGGHDEPQHKVMGETTHALLDAIDIAHAPIPSDAGSLSSLFRRARTHMTTTGLPFALIVRKGQITGSCPPPPLRACRRPVTPVIETTVSTPSTRFEVLSQLRALLPPDAAVVATTGKTGRELFTISDSEQHFYLVGSMGCASAVGLGIALNTERPVVVLDGDGALLMKLGNLATIGAERPSNLIHILLDNGVHDSTGGQATSSSNVAFASVAAASGYCSAVSVTSMEGLSRVLGEALRSPGPHFVRVDIRPGSVEPLGRPTVAPSEVARRFRRFLAGGVDPSPPLRP